MSSIDGSTIQTQIVEFLRDDYSSSGVSVTSYGRGNVVVELPADFPCISTMIEQLSTLFQAECDLSTIGQNPQLTVWYSEDRITTGSDNDNHKQNECDETASFKTDAIEWANLIPKSRIIVGIMFILLLLLGFCVLYSAVSVISNTRKFSV